MEWWGACAWRRSYEAVEMSRRENNGRAKEVKEFRNQSGKMKSGITGTLSDMISVTETQ